MHRRQHDTDISNYLADIGEIPRLSRREELELTSQIVNGDDEGRSSMEARERLILSGLKMVVAMARAYKGCGVTFQDLVAEGNLGLIRSADSFDPSASNARFLTYAGGWVNSAMRRIVSYQKRDVVIGAIMEPFVRKWDAASASMRESTGFEPAPVEIYAALNLGPSVSFERICRAVRARDATFVRDGGVGEDGSPACLDQDLIQEDYRPDIEAESKDEAASLMRIVDRLGELPARVTRMAFGIAPYGEMTNVEIGRVIGVSPRRVAQIRDEAMEKLRCMARGDTPVPSDEEDYQESSGYEDVELTAEQEAWLDSDDDDGDFPELTAAQLSRMMSRIKG